MGMAVGGEGGYNSDINVTPLVDVVLVLLIIFMVITPLTQMGYDVEIPRESQSTIVADPNVNQVILAINAQNCAISEPLDGRPLPDTCTVMLNKIPVPISQLPAKVTEIYTGRRDKLLFLAAEDNLNYEGVVQVLDAAKTGMDGLQIGIVSDPALANPVSEAAAPTL